MERCPSPTIVQFRHAQVMHRKLSFPFDQGTVHNGGLKSLHFLEHLYKCNSQAELVLTLHNAGLK